MAVAWKHLAHPNVAPLIGVTTDPIQLVSGWMPDVDLAGYIMNHSDTDKFSLVGAPFTAPCNILTPSLVI